MILVLVEAVKNTKTAVEKTRKKFVHVQKKCYKKYELTQ